MRYRNDILLRHADYQATVAHLLEFQQLVSDAIALRHSDIELDDAVMLEMAKTWGEREIDAIENAFSNEKRYANAFPQIALRGVFLSAVSYFEEFFRCVARCIDRNSHCRRLSECRRVLLDNWNLSTESSAEEQLWQQLRGSFETVSYTHLTLPTKRIV